MKLFHLFWVILVMATVSCSVARTDSRQTYFPLGTWKSVKLGGWTEESLTEFNEKRFGNQLAAMNEPSLNVLSKETEFIHIRLLVLPSFSPAQAVHIKMNPKQKAEVRRITLNGAGGYGPGGIAEDATHLVSQARFARIETSIERLGLWKAEPLRTRGIMCTDGTQIVLEVAKQDYFHAVAIHECEVMPKFAELLLVFENLFPGIFSGGELFFPKQ